MAIFTGTNQEFRRYIGPRLRNLVQQITKKHKSSVGACEHCGSIENLESAHVHGRERNALIDMIANDFTNGEIIKVDLAKFEDRFRSEHQPMEKAILILCRSCHAAYDAKHSSTAKRQTKSRGDLLPITLSPTPPAAFKAKLLTTKKAEIQVYFLDGNLETKLWTAQRFKSTSNVMSNLRSRPEFRAGAWQERGIVKVHVVVLENTSQVT